MERGHLDVASAQRQIADGELDTVVVAFTDLQGRLVGKRVTGHFFADHVLAAGVEACNYLLAVDVDMTPMPGYEFANWEQGYGDLSCRPDLATLRTVPWLEKTALVLCDLSDDAGEPVAVSPRQVLRHQLERAAARGLTVKCGSELEFYLFRDSYEEARAEGLPRPRVPRAVRAGLPRAPDDPRRVRDPGDPQRDGCGGRPGRVLER